MQNNRMIKYSEAIHEATDQIMALDNSVYIMGLGVPDPKRRRSGPHTCGIARGEGNP